MVDSRDRAPRGLVACSLVVAVLGATLLFPSCASRRGKGAPDGDAAASSVPDDPAFAEPRELAAAGRYREAIEAYEKLRAESRDPLVRGRATYEAGLAYLGQGNSRLAREEFAKVADMTDDPALVAPAQLEIGGLRMREGTWLMAETSLRRALELGLGGDDAMRAHYQLAVVCQKDGRLNEAREHFAAAGSWRPRPDEHYAYAPDADAPDDDESAAPTVKSGPRVATAPTAKRPAIGFEFIPRSAWNANPSRSNSDPMGRVTRVTIHHSGLRDDATQYGDCAVMMKKMQRQHVEDRGWADIGYHFIIDRTGRVWEGRPLDLQGAHAGNNDANAGNVGVALSGDFETQQPTAKQKQSLRKVVEGLMSAYRVPASRLASHQEVKRAFRLSFTECPGKNLQPFVDALRKELAAVERGGGSGGAAATARRAVPAAR